MVKFNSKGKPTASVGQVLSRYAHAVGKYRWAYPGIIILSILGHVTSLWGVFYYKQFFDVLSKSTPALPVTGTLIGFILAVLVLNCCAWLFWRTGTFLQVYYQSGVMRDLRNEAFAYLIDHSYKFFSDNFAGSLVQRINRYANSFDRIGDRIIWDLTPLAVRIVFVFFGIWYFSPQLSIIVTTGALSMMAVQAIISWLKIGYDVEKSEKDSAVTGALADAVSNQTTIQSFAGAILEHGIFGAVNNTWCRIARITWNIDNVIEATQSALIVVVEFLLFYYGVQYWQQGIVTIGTFVLAQTYFLTITSSIWNFGRAIRDFYHSVADAAEMVGILELPHEITDVPSAKKMHVPHGEIIFNDVVFKYHNERSVLDRINITIKPGERVALIGPSGAGKSTLVKLLLRFYDVTSGEILIDGQNVAKVTQESLRTNVSLVPQDPILFHRTLMENIRYGRQNAPDEEVYTAAKLAHCHEFIESLPEKYGTFVGERGIKLSGGERQRVAIARAILKNAPILVLDEATSSLDSHSEMLIQDALDTLMKGKTTIVIAHRLSTIRKMDRIIVMNEGKILEEGSHESLVRKRAGLYKKLWSLQAGGFIPTAVSPSKESREDVIEDEL